MVNFTEINNWYWNDAEDPLAMLYQNGFLTIKGCDKVYNEYQLDFPIVLPVIVYQIST